MTDANVRRESESKHILQMLSGPTSKLSHYTDKDWTRIAESLYVLGCSAETIAGLRRTLSWLAFCYDSQIVNGPVHERDHVEKLRRWKRVLKLSSALTAEIEIFAFQDFGCVPPKGDGSGLHPYDEELLLLKKLKAFAASRVVDLSPVPSLPKMTPKQWYQSKVLEIWTSHGGKLRFSRNHGTQKIEGPLVRYFSAVTIPVYGGSPESLPDILERYSRTQKGSRAEFAESHRKPYPK
jgi:hypothetical protein